MDMIEEACANIRKGENIHENKMEKYESNGKENIYKPNIYNFVEQDDDTKCSNWDQLQLNLKQWDYKIKRQVHGLQISNEF